MRLAELEAELLRTRQETERLRQENRHKLAIIEALKGDPEAVEDYARSELGMVYPHEVLVRIKDQEQR
jgi:cell division protein FtsB